MNKQVVTVEHRYNEVPGDRTTYFVIKRVHYLRNTDNRVTE